MKLLRLGADRVPLLSIVVTCTDRKASVPQQGLRARDLPSGDIRGRALEWKRRVSAASDRFPLDRLYQGDHWTRAQGLAAYARKAGFSPDLWVASAGLGLQHISSSGPAYAATFSPRHADSVAESAEQSATWWQQLQAGGDTDRLEDLAHRGQVMLVLSGVYANALAADLEGLSSTSRDVLLLGGSREIPGITRVRADATLRKALGGTLTSLNVRMAAAWLGHCSNGRLTSPSTHASWQTWVEEVSKQERYNRIPMTDSEVQHFIRESRAIAPGTSRTALLRALRDSGRACEQKRFADLYAATTTENR